MNTQSSVDTRIKVGIIGFGRMGRFYWEAMTKSDRWNIAYICDTDPESRQLAKELAPGSLIVEDNQKIFEDESVQVVGLFTLADSRMEQIEKAIRYGKHIISEKPVADTMENEWKVVEMTENTNLISTVNLYLRNSWYHNLMKEYIQQGEIGELAIIRICHMTPGLAPGEGHEADDLLGTVAKRMEKKGLDVSVVSGDRDLLQLATEHIMIRIPKTKRTGTEIEDYHTKEVLEKYQVTPPQIIELKAMMGDASDNIPGLPGVGEKTATKLVVAYGTIENACAHVEEIKPTKAKNAFLEHYDLAVLSKKLATIDTDSPIDFVLEDARLTDLYTPEAFALFKKLEFKNLLGRFQCDAPDQKIEQYFYAVEDFGEAEDVFAQAAGAALVSFSVISHKGEVKGISLG